MTKSFCYDDAVSPSLADEKAAVRAAMARRIAELTVDQIAAESRHLVSFLQTWTQAEGFDVVLATLPLAGEPDLVPFLEWWLADGRRVALARTGSHRSMEFREVASLEGPWETKRYGMREPLATARLWEPGSKTLALVPGLAFAPAEGGATRLGRGAGYYDRWLAQFGSALFSLGVGFSVQSVETLPIEPHDHRLDGWVDASGLKGFELKRLG